MQLNEIQSNKRFKIFRESLNKKQGDFANELNTNQQSISDIERGIKNISLEIIENLCLLYNLNANWLITSKGEMLLSESTNQVHYSNLAEAEKDILHLKDKIKDLEDKIEMQKEIIEMLKKSSTI